MVYSVSYYVPAEGMWQFAGEWQNQVDALKRAKYLLQTGGNSAVRIRCGDKTIWSKNNI